MNKIALRLFFMIGMLLGSAPLVLGQQDTPEPDEIEVSFENACQDTILVWVHYKAAEEGWITKGWYWVPPGETKYVLNTPNAVLYYHARNVKGDRVWEGREMGWNFKEKYYGFKEIRVDEKIWDYTKRLVCD